jgi:hypothetical protein
MMRRILILAACIVLGSALSANAMVTSDGIGGTLMDLGGGKSQIDLSLLAAAVPAGKTVMALDATCMTVEPGASFKVGGTTANWGTHTFSNGFQAGPLVVGQPANPQETFFNFDTKNDAIINTGTLPNLTSFTGSAFSSDVSTDLTAGSLLGSVIVNNGMWVHISGTLVYRDQTTRNFDALVPEPGTLAMLVAGVALLGLRWLRRR